VKGESVRGKRAMASNAEYDDFDAKADDVVMSAVEF
jgi:hypothetical protein